MNEGKRTIEDPGGERDDKGRFVKDLPRKHGHAIAGKIGRTYRCWLHMRERCFTPSTKQFEDYGGRGITICERWNDFSNFLADMGEVPPGLTLDRRDNDGHYEPSNCRWATRREQQGNRRNSRLVEINDEKICLSEASRRTGVKLPTVFYRIRHGKPESEWFKPVKTPA